MTELEKILVENLREGLRQFQTYLTWGIGAALSFLLLSISDLGSETVGLPIPGAFASVNTTFARIIALAIAWVAGALATYTYERIVRIKAELWTNAKLLRTVLTYPSVLTVIYPGVSLIAVFVPGACIVGGFIFIWNNIPGDFGWRLFLATVSLAPYIVLAGELIAWPVPVEKPILKDDRK
jgi:hypothetical protein